MQPDGVEGEEVTGEDTVGLLAQERPSGAGGAGSCTHRPEAVNAQHPADRGRRHSISESDQVTLDSLVSPAAVLASQPHDRLLHLGWNWRSAQSGVRVGPVPGDHPPMPAEQRARRHQKRPTTAPAAATGSVRRARPDPSSGAAVSAAGGQDLQLVAQHQDLDCVGVLGSAAEHEQFHQAAERQVHERPHDRPTTMLTGRCGTLPGHPSDLRGHGCAIGTLRDGPSLPEQESYPTRE